MRCLSTALASVCLLAPALAIESTSSAYVVFEDLPQTFPVDYLDFALSVHEATDPCARPNVSINKQALPEIGSGTFTTRQDYTFDATWNFTCVDARGAAKEQIMSLSINSVSGTAVEDMQISLHFRQVVPMAISSIKGPASMALFGDRSSGDGSEQQPSPEKLAAELDEIDTLRSRAAEIHRIIRTRERLVAESYGWVRSNFHHGLKDCDSIGCFVKSLLNKVGSFAASLFHGGGDHHHHHRWRGPPRWWRHRFHHPGDGAGCGHGNATRTDQPPWRKPHFRHGPPTGDFPAPGSHGDHHQHSPPPSSDEDGAPISGTQDWSTPSLNHPLHGHGFGRHDRPHSWRPGPGHHGYGPPPPYGRDRRLSPLAKVSLCLVGLGVIIALLHRRCKGKRGGSDNTNWCQRFRARREARSRRRAEFRAAVGRARERLGASLRRLASGSRGDGVDDDEEKVDILLKTWQQKPAGDGGPDSSPETTVEEEIAGLRVAADMVSDIVAAEQGRPARRSVDSGHSRYSEALPLYQATGPLLPASTKEQSSPALSLVADGFLYTPSSSAYDPSDRSSSLSGFGSADPLLGDTKD